MSTYKKVHFFCPVLYSCISVKVNSVLKMTIGDTAEGMFHKRQ